MDFGTQINKRKNESGDRKKQAAQNFLAHCQANEKFEYFWKQFLYDYDSPIQYLKTTAILPSPHKNNLTCNPS